jgi:hypothetical protein
LFATSYEIEEFTLIQFLSKLTENAKENPFLEIAAQHPVMPATFTILPLKNFKVGSTFLFMAFINGERENGKRDVIGLIPTPTQGGKTLSAPPGRKQSMELTGKIPVQTSITTIIVTSNRILNCAVPIVSLHTQFPGLFIMKNPATAW